MSMFNTTKASAFRAPGEKYTRGQTHAYINDPTAPTAMAYNSPQQAAPSQGMMVRGRTLATNGAMSGGTGGGPGSPAGASNQPLNYQEIANTIRPPNSQNAMIAGREQYQGNVTQIGNNALNYANSVNNTTNAFAADARARDARFQSGDAYGARQQMDAYGRMANMADGQGPSLARANMQAGLAQQNAAIQAQGMSLGGAGGYGNSQRNILNAQTATGNNVMNQGNVASVAEQLGALQQLGAQSNAMTQAGLGSAALAGQQQLGAYGLGASSMQNAQNMQMGGYDRAFGADVAQTNALQNQQQLQLKFDQTQADIRAAELKRRQELYGDSVVGFFDNLGGGDNGPGGTGPMADMQNRGTYSDERLKTNVTDTSGVQLQDFLTNLNKEETPQAAPTAAPVMTSSTMPIAPPAASGAPSFAINPVGGGTDSSGSAGEAPAKSDSMGKLMSIVGTVAMAMSDENVKTNVNGTAPPALDEFMSTLQPKSFDYKSHLAGTAEAPGGRNHGIMAQDMEKSAIGRDIVMDTPKGKAIPYGKAMSVTLASLAHLHKRLAAVEAQHG